MSFESRYTTNSKTGKKILKDEKIPTNISSDFYVSNGQIPSIVINKLSSDFSLKKNLKDNYLLHFPGVLSFLEENLKFEDYSIQQSVVIRSADIYNVEVLHKESLRFFCNLNRINDFRRINQYFIALNDKLKKDGIYVGMMEPVCYRYFKFLNEYPSFIAKFFYVLDFFWRRVCPKLHITKQLYFLLTKGRNRSISFAEGLGRLVYCGFEIVSVKEINGNVFFIARKTGDPVKSAQPSYGPFFKMKRIGKNGKIIYVYKMRTMHPFSEFIQKYAYERNSLQEGGKIKYDFRVTTWGRIFRKLWIDELPMLVNFFIGDMKLIGVRPLSEHYLSLYTPELRERRKNYKPGLAPPFYAYRPMPKTLAEIMASEIKYFDEYDKAPILTDIKYFFKIFWTIAFKKARSN
jgi:Sugar transferases involved in lipopolysaccharide synthesis